MTSRRYPDTSHVRLRNHVKIPMLMIGATGDTVAPFVSDKVRRVGNPHVQVIEIDANHFDPYFDPLFPEVLAHQLTFLRR